MPVEEQMKYVFLISDYCYYSIARANFKDDGSFASSALFSVSAMQTFILLIVFGPVSAETTIAITNSTKYVGYPAGLLFTLICWLNHRRYKGKYLALRERWQDETPTQRRVRKVLASLSVYIAAFFMLFMWWVGQLIVK